MPHLVASDLLLNCLSMPTKGMLAMRGSRNFSRGGGSRPDGQKAVWTFFCECVFLVLNYFTVYSGGQIVLLQRKLYFCKDIERVQHFPGEGGPNANFYRNPYNL